MLFIMDKPEVHLLDKYLKDLVFWEQFALYLPEIKQPHIDTIKREVEKNIAEQKIALFNKWLQMYPEASWQNVIYALENVDQKTIATNLQAQFIKVDVPKKFPSQNLLPTEQHMVGESHRRVKVSKNVVDQLVKMNNEFISLTKKFISEVTSRAENGQKSIEDLIEHVELNDVYDIEFQSVQSANQFFKKIKPHYNFLDCYLLVDLACLRSDEIAKEAQTYREKTELFMRNTEIVELHQQLQPYFPYFNSESCVSVLIALENAWGKQNVWVVKQLVKQLFNLEHPEQCQWFRVVPGSSLIIFSSSIHLTTSLLKNSSKKLQLMRLVGVISLQIGDSSVFNQEENKMFSFEKSLIQATVDNNIEAAQFLLEHVHVNVNIQTEQPIMRTNKKYFREEEVIHESNSFHGSFASLMEDCETELWLSDKAILTSIARDIPFLESSIFNTSDEFFKHFRTCQIFLNPLPMDKLVRSLSDSLPDDERDILKPLAEKVNQYVNRIELFKKQVQLAYINVPLQKYHVQPENAIQVTLMLKKAWHECSMYVVEHLLQLIFFNTHISLFQWFSVYANTEFVTVVFLLPEHLAGLNDELNKNLAKVKFMSKTMGIIGLNIGEESFKAFENTRDIYSFKNALDQAKAEANADIGCNNNYINEAVSLLQKILQERLNIRNMSEMDENGNFIRNISSKSTPLMIACCDDNRRMVELLLKYNADLNVENDRKMTALMYVSMYGNTKTFKHLCDHGANIKRTCLLGNNILFSACQTGNIEIIKQFLKRDHNNNVLPHEDVNRQRHDGMTPLTLLSCHYHPQDMPLDMASCHRQRQIAEQLIYAQADVNIHDAYGLPPLNRASHNGCIKMVEQLLRAKANPKICDITGKTSLYLASDQGRLEIVERLLKVGVEPNLANNNGMTPLHIAAKHGHQLIVERLLQAQADPNIKDKSGLTSLDIARKEGNVGILELLQQKKNNSFTYSSVH